MTAHVRAFDHLVFDLDDTLLDTYRQLLPRASREACSAMITAGLSSSVEQCLSAWEAHSRTPSRREIFSSLVSQLGVREGADARTVADRGHHAFYNRQVETDISLFPGARELLTRLREHYTLHLVTAGPRETQREKIRLLKLEGFFDSIWHIDPTLNERKLDAFTSLMQRTQALPERHLSIGNRVDTDIAEARQLGWRACWVRYGEHAAMLPANSLEKPDYNVDLVTEVETQCQL